MLEHLKNFFYKIIEHKVFKYSIPVFCLALLFTIVLGVFLSCKVHHKLEVEIESDKAGTIQVFWPDRKGRYSEADSISKLIKAGENHIVFQLEYFSQKKLKEIRLDPTNNSNSKINIKGIRYIYNNRSIYQVPLEKINTFTSVGIRFISVSPDKASIFTLNRDPVLLMKPDMMTQYSLSTANNSFAIILKIFIISLFLWLFLLHCLRNYFGVIYPNLYKTVKILLPISYIISGVGGLYFLWFNTQLLGKVTCGLLLLYGVKYLLYKEWEKEKKSENIRANFDWGMHYFRAIAIVCICLGHTLMGAGKGAWSWMLFQADSVYFLFISGYLAQYLFAKKEESPWAYYKKKIYNVISPYIVFSSLILIYVYFTCPSPGLYNKPFTLKDVLSAFLLGKAAVAYWYIPFVSILFLATPFFIRLSSKNFINFLFIFGALAIIFPQRNGISAIENRIYPYTYFTFSYMLGMAFSRYRETMEDFFYRIFYYATSIAFLISILIAYNSDWKLIISNIGLLCNFQKILFVISFIVILGYLKNKKISLLNNLAEYSFTIYFIHLIFYKDYQQIYNIVISFINVSDIMAVLTGIAFIFYMLFLSILLKKILGKYSRYFIGS